MDSINEYLKKIVIQSYEKVPYYNNLFNNMNIDPYKIQEVKDFIQLPLLKKEVIRNLPEDFLSQDYHLGHDDIFQVRTSGSTGQFLKIFWSKEDSINSLSSLWLARLKMYGIYPYDRFCTFHSFLEGYMNDIPDELVYNDDRTISFSKLNLDQEHMEKYYKRILEFAPKWIYGQPSTVLLLAQFIKDNKLSIPESIKYIELTGEYLSDWCKKYIKDVFKVPVANMYGCIETNGIAIECTHGNLHCLENNVFVEILKNGQPVPQGEEGGIYITSLTNKTMPFIRYGIGDRGIVHSSGYCSCGRKGRVLQLSAGRTNQFAIIEGKEPVSCFIFYYAVENINTKQGYPIIQFQIIQESYTKFIVRFVMDKESKTSKEMICKQFEEDMKKINIKNVEWQFVFENQLIPNEETGKLQFFISNISKEKSK